MRAAVWTRRTATAALLAVCGLAIAVPDRAAGQAADPDPARFAAEIEAFRQWDAKNAVPADGVLFAGSSTIRLWPTADRFPRVPVINRGFGGSQISDVNHYFDDVVRRYRPAVIVFYAGDNDINAGRTPERVAADFRAFVDKVRAIAPDVRTRVLFLAIKPSPDRWEKWPLMREANDRIRAFIAERSSDDRVGLVYVDVATPMLTAGGQTQSRFYVADGLHLSQAGYDLWTQVLAPILDRARTP